MNSKIDNYNQVVDLIGNIVKATSDPSEQEDVDKALDIAHTIGNVLDTTDNNTNFRHGNDTK